MFSSNEQVAFKEVLKEFNSLKKAEYSYAYTTGYNESMCSEMFRYLPKKQQKFFMEQIKLALTEAKVAA